MPHPSALSPHVPACTTLDRPTPAASPPPCRRLGTARVGTSRGGKTIEGRTLVRRQSCWAGDAAAGEWQGAAPDVPGAAGRARRVDGMGRARLRGGEAAAPARARHALPLPLKQGTPVEQLWRGVAKAGHGSSQSLVTPLSFPPIAPCPPPPPTPPPHPTPTPHTPDLCSNGALLHTPLPPISPLPPFLPSPVARGGEHFLERENDSGGAVASPPTAACAATAAACAATAQAQTPASSSCLPTAASQVPTGQGTMCFCFVQFAVATFV